MIYLLSHDTTKNWVRVETTSGGDNITGNCSDDLTYKFMAILNKSDTSGYLFIKPDVSACNLENFCMQNPQLCDDHQVFCEQDSAICAGLENDFLFAGSWYIPQPEEENGKVNEMIIKNYEGILIYQISYITSVDMELRHTQNEIMTNEIFKAR